MKSTYREATKARPTADSDVNSIGISYKSGSAFWQRLAMSMYFLVLKVW